MARTQGFTVPKFGRALRLTPRLILFMVVVSAVPVVLMGLIGFNAGSEGIRRHTDAHLLSVVIVKAQEVENWFRPLEAASNVLANSSLVKKEISVLLEAPDDETVANSRETLLIYFADLSRRNPGLQRIEVISWDHKSLLVSNRPNSPVANDHYPGYMRNVVAGQLVTLPPFVPGEETPTATIAAPIIQDGETLAYLVLQASPVSLYETLAPDAGLGPDAKVYLVNRLGEVLTPPQQFPAGSNFIHASGLMTESPDATGTGLHYKDFLGTDVLGAYMPLDALGWAVVVEVPAAEALSDINRMRWGIIGASVVFVVLVLIVSLLITGHITRPLKRLIVGAQSLGSGDLSHRIEVDSTDEIGMLAASFNQMAEDLRETQHRMVEAERSATVRSFTETKMEQLRQLSRLGLLIATESTLEGLVSHTPSMVKDITGADLGVVVVLNEDGETVEKLGHTGLHASWRLNGLLQRPEEFRSLMRDLPANADLDLTIHSPKGKFKEFNDTLSLPIRSETGAVVGGIIAANVTSDTPFTQEDKELAQIIAGYASAVLQKLRKESRLQESERKAVEAVEELRRTQEQLLQSQKMEAVGQLAGGVAHDFNNLLTAIMGYTQLAVMALPPGEHPKHELQEIQKAGERASNLTSQLLAFSRRQIIEPRIVNLNDLVGNMESMLRRLIGENIELETLAEPELEAVKLDPGQFEQVLMNLAVNARDAMPHGGKITIGTANMSGRELSKLGKIKNGTLGDYALLTVSDNGAGIPEEVQAHIFEPFFTTKDLGKGTGLGLATCYGIVEQNGGLIEVYSEPDRGATFKIYFPVTSQEEEVAGHEQTYTGATGGTETVLLAEDETLVRELASRILRDQGYIVLEAENGQEALEVARHYYDGQIDLLVTDVIMPQMGGKDLSEHISELFPGISVLYTSGYTDDAIVSYGVLDPGTNFLQKPFSPTTLAAKVRDVLNTRVA